MLRSLAAAAARLPAAAARPRLLHLGSGVGGGAEEVESMAYRMSMLRAPPVERKKVVTSNSCSLIGRLGAAVRPYNGSSEDDPSAYTFLSVPLSSSSPSKFKP